MITIFTIVDKNEEFIELQYRSIIKFVQNKFKYVVFNNSSDSNRRKHINEICKIHNIQCIEINVNYDQTPSMICADSLNYIWKNYISIISGLMFCIDSDMFFISPINIEDIMDHYDILYMPQYRGKNDEVKYIWAGLFCIDNKLVEDINFSIGYPEGIQTDTGGMTHYFLKENKLNERYLNSNHIFTYENNILDVNLDGCKQEKFSYIYTDFYEHLFLANKFNFPKPYCFDLFKIAGKVKHFIFHFRSANWANIYNDKEYFQNKKIALFNMMKTLLNE